MYFPIHVDFVCFQFLPFIDKAAMKIHVEIILWTLLLRKGGMGLLNYKIVVCLL